MQKNVPSIFLLISIYGIILFSGCGKTTPISNATSEAIPESSIEALTPQVQQTSQIFIPSAPSTTVAFVTTSTSSPQTPISSQTVTSQQTPASSPQISVPSAPSPEELARLNFYDPQIPRVTGEELKQMMDNGNGFILVDVRVQSAYKGAHLPGSVNVPYKPEAPLSQEWVTNTLLSLPKDKPIIFYCDCPDDKESAEMAEEILGLNTGYDPVNIEVLWKGYYRWIELGYPLSK